MNHSIRIHSEVDRLVNLVRLEHPLLALPLGALTVQVVNFCLDTIPLVLPPSACHHDGEWEGLT
jgi:hypothetical protein